MENTKSRVIEEVIYSAEQSMKESKKGVEDISDVLTCLVLSLQIRQAELIEAIQEKQKAAERQAQDQVIKLEQEVAELRRRRSEMERRLQTEDQLHLLQSCASLHSPPSASGELPAVSPQSYMGMVEKAMAQMEKTLSNELKILIHEVRLADR